MQKSHMSQSEAAVDSAVINPIDAFRILRPVSGVLLSRMALYARLVGIEWAEQKARLSGMLAITLLGFASFLCFMLFAGALVTMLSWDSAYRIQAIVAVIASYAAVTGIAWLRFQSLSTRSDQAFAATREEFAADIALIKSKL
jgi:uncharacterized membrane protein YqjE